MNWTWLYFTSYKVFLLQMIRFSGFLFSYWKRKFWVSFITYLKLLVMLLNFYYCCSSAQISEYTTKDWFPITVRNRMLLVNFSAARGAVLSVGCLFTRNEALKLHIMSCAANKILIQSCYISLSHERDSAIAIDVI